MKSILALVSKYFILHGTVLCLAFYFVPFLGQSERYFTVSPLTPLSKDVKCSEWLLVSEFRAP